MKSLIFAYVTFALLTATVFINSYVVSLCLGELKGRLDEIPCEIDAEEEYRKAYSEFEKSRKFINLTVSHADLSDIEKDFNELLGALEANDEDSLTIIKSRLVGSISHMRRLAGVNFDSIF